MTGSTFTTTPEAAMEFTIPAVRGGEDYRVTGLPMALVAIQQHAALAGSRLAETAWRKDQGKALEDAAGYFRWVASLADAVRVQLATGETDPWPAR